MVYLKNFHSGVSQSPQEAQSGSVTSSQLAARAQLQAATARLQSSTKARNRPVGSALRGSRLQGVPLLVRWGKWNPYKETLVV